MLAISFDSNTPSNEVEYRENCDGNRREAAVFGLLRNFQSPKDGTNYKTVRRNLSIGLLVVDVGSWN